jgi:hypothetical protein
VNYEAYCNASFPILLVLPCLGIQILSSAIHSQTRPMYVLSLTLHILQRLLMVGYFEKYSGASVTVMSDVRTVCSARQLYHVHFLEIGAQVRQTCNFTVHAIRATLTTNNPVFWMNRTRNYQEGMSLGNNFLCSFVLTSTKQYFTDGRYTFKTVSIISEKGHWSSQYHLNQISEPECDDTLMVKVSNTQMLLVSVRKN